jgi:hypothetical protein
MGSEYINQCGTINGLTFCEVNIMGTTTWEIRPHVSTVYDFFHSEEL